LSGISANGSFGSGQKARLMVRPEAFHLERNQKSAELAVEIVDVAFYGERRRIVARTGAGQEIDIRPTSSAMASHDATASRRQVFFDPAAAFLFPA
ncbi:MAG: TOBE domain-containing protein, partial [Mesorhizobium sp.]